MPCVRKLRAQQPSRDGVAVRDGLRPKGLAGARRRRRTRRGCDPAWSEPRSAP